MQNPLPLVPLHLYQRCHLLVVAAFLVDSNCGCDPPCSLIFQCMLQSFLCSVERRIQKQRKVSFLLQPGSCESHRRVSVYPMVKYSVLLSLPCLRNGSLQCTIGHQDLSRHENSYGLFDFCDCEFFRPPKLGQFKNQICICHFVQKRHEAPVDNKLNHFADIGCIRHKFHQ